MSPAGQEAVPMTPEQEAALARARAKSVKTSSEPGIVTDPNAPGGGLSPFTAEQQIALRRARERVANEKEGAAGRSTNTCAPECAARARASPRPSTSCRNWGRSSATASTPSPGGRSLTTRRPSPTPTTRASSMSQRATRPPTTWPRSTARPCWRPLRPSARAAPKRSPSPRPEPRRGLWRAARPPQRREPSGATPATSTNINVWRGAGRSPTAGPAPASSAARWWIPGQGAGSLLGAPVTVDEIGAFISSAAAPAVVVPPRGPEPEHPPPTPTAPSVWRPATAWASSPRWVSTARAAAGHGGWRHRLRWWPGLPDAPHPVRGHGSRGAADRGGHARSRRGSPSQPVPSGGRISEGSIGQDVQHAAETARDASNAAETAIWNPFLDRQGRESVIPDIPVMDQMRDTASNARQHSRRADRLRPQAHRPQPHGRSGGGSHPHRRPGRGDRSCPAGSGAERSAASPGRGGGAGNPDPARRIDAHGAGEGADRPHPRREYRHQRLAVQGLALEPRQADRRDTRQPPAGEGPWPDLQDRDEHLERRRPCAGASRRTSSTASWTRPRGSATSKTSSRPWWIRLPRGAATIRCSPRPTSRGSVSRAPWRSTPRRNWRRPSPTTSSFRPGAPRPGCRRSTRRPSSLGRPPTSGGPPGGKSTALCRRRRRARRAGRRSRGGLGSGRPAPDAHAPRCRRQHPRRPAHHLHAAPSLALGAGVGAMGTGPGALVATLPTHPRPSLRPGLDLAGARPARSSGRRRPSLTRAARAVARRDQCVANAKEGIR